MRVARRGPGVWAGTYLPPQPPVTTVVTGWAQLLGADVDFDNSIFDPSLDAFVADFGPRPVTR